MKQIIGYTKYHFGNSRLIAFLSFDIAGSCLLLRFGGLKLFLVYLSGKRSALM